MTEPSAEFLAKRIGLSHLGPADLRVLLADTSRAFASWRTNWLSSARLRVLCSAIAYGGPSPWRRKLMAIEAVSGDVIPGARSARGNHSAAGIIAAVSRYRIWQMTPAEVAREKIQALDKVRNF